MPKKRASIHFTKPDSPAHPSLSFTTKDASRSLTSSAPSGNLVNDRIKQLRLEQNAASPSAKTIDPPPVHTVHPSVRHVLQIPDGPPLRPRPGLRVVAGRRIPPGPRPPDSWLQKKSRLQKTASTAATGPDTLKVEELPGLYMPDPGSLLDRTLRALAKNWTWHAVYDQYYLAALPIRYKQALLRYIALHNPHEIDHDGLKILFLEESELRNATGASGLTHLDLATSIGHSLSFVNLEHFFAPRKTPAATGTSDDLPESWDTPSLPDAPSNLPRFATVTHLSLSHPPQTISWKSFLSLTPNLSTLTHLSLAFWPTPTLSPNAKTAYLSTPSGKVPFGGTHYYSELDNDWSEAASIMRRLSKSTLCLEYLDLTGCHPWTQCLKDSQLDWRGSWAGLQTIKIGQGWLPEYIHILARTTPSPASPNDPLPNSPKTPPPTPHQLENITKWASLERTTLSIEHVIHARCRYDGTEKQAQALLSLLDREGLLESWPEKSVRALRAREAVTAPRAGRIEFVKGWEGGKVGRAVEIVLGEGVGVGEGEGRGQFGVGGHLGRWAGGGRYGDLAEGIVGS